MRPRRARSACSSSSTRNKGDVLLHQGVREMEQYFILDGMLKRVVSNAQGKEMILRFAAEGDMETSYAAWRMGTPTPYGIVCVTKARVVRTADAAVGRVPRAASGRRRSGSSTCVMRLMSEVMAHTITLHLLDAPGRVQRFLRKRPGAGRPHSAEAARGAPEPVGRDAQPPAAQRQDLNAPTAARAAVGVRRSGRRRARSSRRSSLRRIGASTNFAARPAMMLIAALKMNTRSQLPPTDSTDGERHEQRRGALRRVQRAGVRRRVLDAERVGTQRGEDRVDLAPEQEDQRRERHERGTGCGRTSSARAARGPRRRRPAASCSRGRCGRR